MSGNGSRLDAFILKVPAGLVMGSRERERDDRERPRCSPVDALIPLPNDPPPGPRAKTLIRAPGPVVQDPQ